MTHKKPEQEKEVTPKGAVEVDEEKLDQASGGLESFSRTYSKIEIDSAQKVAPSDALTPTTSIAMKI
jgi:hypothetical protein